MFFKKTSRAIGVHPPQNKGTQGMAFVEVNGFKTITIPLNLQVGPGCSALVKKGDPVKVGQKIGEPLGHWSVPAHSSVSGTVVSVKKEILSNGSVADLVAIESDGQQTLDESIKPPAVTDKASFLSAIRDSGLVGLGGAAFPTHVKLNPPDGKTIDTLVINGAECEPYITADDQIMRTRADRIIKGINLVCHYLDISRCLIGVEDNKPEAIKALNDAINSHAGELKAGISVVSVKTLYPTGAEKVLIRYLTDRIVPENGLPADVGVVVLNVGTVSFIADVIDTGMPLIRKFVTVDGSAMNRRGNYDLPIGAPIEDVIEAVGGAKGPIGKVIMGGPMMGVAIDDIRHPILKHTNSLIMAGEKGAKIPKEWNCIHCGRCSRSCPMMLMPSELDMAARQENIEELREFHVMNCIECGCCTYVCPAKRYLVQNIRIGKNLYRQAARKAAK